MIRILHDTGDTSLPAARAEGDALWVERADVERATGWAWKPEGLCHDDTCMPLPPRPERPMTDGERLDIAAVWRYAGWPVLHDDAARIWVLGEGAAQRAAALSTLQAPDFELPDLDGKMHRLSDYRGRRVFMVAWASWCGCRLDLPVWQSLTESTQDQNFTVLAIALDEPAAARPWIEAASPTYPCLIDREHRVADLYHLVNVPQAVWIDEEGRLVRPPENAGSTDGFREMDRQSLEMPAQALSERQRVKQLYVAAVKDWAQRGAASPYALDEAGVAERLRVPDGSIAEAHARFRLAQALLREGRADEARTQFAEATRLHPDSWAMWRQSAGKDERGFASGADFWARVDALGDRPYHMPVEIAGLPAPGQGSDKAG